MTLRITYLGHATLQIELAETTLLTDPVLRRAVFGGIIRRTGLAPKIDPPDAVLISHQHADHLDLPSLKMLEDTLVIAPSGAGKRIRRAGIQTVREASAGDSIAVGDAEIVATPAIHDGRRLPFGTAVEALGYEIRGAGTRVYFAGDTDLFDEMSELAGVDVALLPIGGWGTRVGPGHLDPERAAKAAAMLQARVVIPIHWGALLRADLHRRRTDLLTTPAEEFQVRLAALAPDTRLELLEPGATFEL
jgi:L-ascorbate metabolism protein UlaG (beta-lactamase superfamily)